MRRIYQTTGTCSKQILTEVENGIVKDVQFLGGCHGNLQGIAKLVIGMKVEEVIDKLQGISCNGKPTSCPDQLTKALQAHVD